MSSPTTAWRSRWGRTLGMLTIAGAVMLGAAAPAFADPGGPDVPNPGLRPNPGESLPGLPGGSPGRPGTPGSGLPDTQPPEVDPPAIGPLGSQITAEERTVEALGEQVKDATDRLAGLRKLLDSARRAAKAADQAADRAEKLTGSAANKAYRDEAAVPESLRDATDGLEALAPGMRDSAALAGNAAAENYKAALDLAKLAHETLDAAQDAVWDAAEFVEKLRGQYEKRSAALDALKERNADALREAQETADKYAAKLKYDPGSAVHGLLPNPKAIKAVRYALSQRGKPYVWGDEGPDSFDCSGLVLAAYQYAGVNVGGRTARAQFYATRVVAPGYLLPGDLIFFGHSKTDPESIHHVGIYIGNGKIVHAPTAGDVVKVSPIWWWEFFAATRVVPAVKAPTRPKPSPSPSPTPTPKPTTSPKPSPSWSTSPSPSKSPSSAPSPAPAPGDSSRASPSASPSASSSAGSSQDCPSPSPSTSTSGSPSPSPSPSASGSASPSSSPCTTGTSGTTETTSTSGGTSVSYAWAMFAPSQTPATVAARRRTRSGCRPERRRRRPDQD